jgi:hypothetical protein
MRDKKAEISENLNLKMDILKKKFQRKKFITTKQNEWWPPVVCTCGLCSPDYSN